MLRFLKSVLKSILVTLISFTIIVLAFIAIAVSSGMEEDKKTKKNTLLEINLSEKIVDRSSDFSCYAD